LAPLVSEIDPKSFDLIVHPLSKIFIESFFQDRKYQLLDLRDYSPEQFWEKKVCSYDVVITTTSSKMIDKTNAILIEICRKNDIPTLGFLDHWKGFDRFYDEKGESSYLPNWLGVIDDKTKKRLELRDLVKTKVSVIGQPWLDFLKKKSHRASFKEEKKSIILISQPDPFNNFESIFCEKNNKDVVNEYLSLMKAKGYNAYYRAHPKESESCYNNLSLDESNFLDIFEKYEIFIGYDSMMLLEAFAMGKKVICLDPLYMKNISDYKIPIKFGISIEKPFSDSPSENNQFQNSISKGKELIRDFLGEYDG
jgi:hypothetical protein